MLARAFHEEARAAIAADPDSGFADIDPDDLPEGAGMGGEMPPGMEGGGELDDVDKAGAVYDAALDARRWCTTEKGKHFELDTESGEITKGLVGQRSGAAVDRRSAIEEKIASIRIQRGKDSVLPNLNTETLAELGKVDKPVLLKKEVLERNASRHADVPLDEARSLIGEALYNPVQVLRGNNRKDYLNFIGVDKERHCVVLLDVEDAKDNFEIVHWHRVNMKGVKKLERKAQKIEDETGKEGQA